MNKQGTLVIAALVAIATFTTSALATARQAQTTSEKSQSTIAQGQSSSEQNQNKLSSLDRQFVLEAAQGGMAEVQLGELASHQAVSSDVKQFGQQMVQDHTQANNQLKQLAQQKGVTLPNGIGDENRMERAELSKLSGAAFDQAYMNHMLQDHVKDISLFEREAQQGQDPQIKAWASKTLPTLQMHLRMARTITGSNTGTSMPRQ